ncbi:hypothetical protein PAMA_007173 [Pampus argenteus]
MIKSINPALVNLKESLCREPRENIQQAFTIAHHSLDIPPLLEPEDVACTSPDEQSIITYVSLFLHYSGIDEDYTSDIEVNIPQIPNFGSLEELRFGEIDARDPKAKGLLRGLEKSSEQQLWKRWARRSSGGLHATSQVSKKKTRCSSVLQPPSPLDTGVFSQEIQAWLEKGSVDQGYSKPRGDESFSLSSEEGIYSLSALDSDEEDAYNYILDLNKEVFQPYNHPKRISRVEEETEDEMNGKPTEESEHPKVSKMFNDSGCKRQEGSLVENVDCDQELEVGDLSVAHREFDLYENDSSFREMANNSAVLDVRPPDESKAEHEEERAGAGKSNDDGEEESGTEKTENARLVRNGYDKTESLVAEDTCWKKDVVEETEVGLSEKCAQVSEKRDEDEDEEHLLTFKKGQNGGSRTEKDEEDDVKEEEGGYQQSVVNLETIKTGNEKILIDEAVREVSKTSVAEISTKEESDGRDAKMEDFTKNCKDEEKEEDTDEVKYSTDFEAFETVDETDRKPELRRRKHVTEKKATIIQHPGETTLKSDTDGGVHGRDGENNLTCRSISEGGIVLPSLAASCDTTPLELEMLLFLWIILYCCLILYLK